jgi:hypothetical protein
MSITTDLNKLTVAQCDEILELCGVDVMAPPELISFAQRYAALAFYRRHKAGEKITFADICNSPIADVVGAMSDVDPTNRAGRRAAAAQAKKPSRRSGSKNG